MTTPTTATTTTPAGWYADPADRSLQRWWDGSAWTHHVQIAQTGQAVVVSHAVVADAAPRREATAAVGAAGAVGLGAILPWMSFGGESISMMQAAPGVALVFMGAAGFLGWYGYRALTSGRVRYSAIACAVLVLGFFIAGSNTPPDEVEMGIGAALAIFGLLAQIWTLVVLWRHEKKINGIETGTVAAAQPLQPAPVPVPARTSAGTAF